MSQTSRFRCAEKLPSLFKALEDLRDRRAEEDARRHNDSEVFRKRRRVYEAIKEVQDADSAPDQAKKILNLANALKDSELHELCLSFAPGDDHVGTVGMELLTAAIDGCEADLLRESLVRLSQHPQARSRAGPLELLDLFFDELALFLKNHLIKYDCDPGNRDDAGLTGWFPPKDAKVFSEEIPVTGDELPGTKSHKEKPTSPDGPLEPERSEQEEDDDVLAKQLAKRGLKSQQIARIQGVRNRLPGFADSIHRSELAGIGLPPTTVDADFEHHGRNRGTLSGSCVDKRTFERGYLIEFVTVRWKPRAN